VDKHVISGTQTLVISGTRSTWFQEPRSALSICASKEISAPNSSNRESFGFLLTDPARIHPEWKSTKPACTTITPHFNQKGGLGKATIALDLPAGRAPQGGPIIFTDVSLQEENGDCWLDLSEVPPNEGLTRFFRVCFLPLKRRREAHDVELAADKIIREPPPFGVRMRSASFVSVIAQRSPHLASKGKVAPVEMDQRFEKALIVHVDLDPCFLLSRCGLRVLTARQKVKALAKKNRLTSHSHAGRRPARKCCAGRSARRSHGPEGDHVRCQNLELSLITACNHANVFSTRRKDFGGVAIRKIMRSITA